MDISANGIDLIKRFEGCRLIAYRDGRGIATIGFGHTAGVDMDMRITQDQADSFLHDDLQEFCGYVNRYVKVPLTQNQFDAMVSFTYNLGPGTLWHSRLLADVNHSDFENAADEFLKYDHSGGARVLGLTRRRTAERDLFVASDTAELASNPTFGTKIKQWFGRKVG